MIKKNLIRKRGFMKNLDAFIVANIYKNYKLDVEAKGILKDFTEKQLKTNGYQTSKYNINALIAAVLQEAADYSVNYTKKKTTVIDKKAILNGIALLKRASDFNVDMKYIETKNRTKSHEEKKRYARVKGSIELPPISVTSVKSFIKLNFENTTFKLNKKDAADDSTAILYDTLVKRLSAKKESLLTIESNLYNTLDSIVKNNNTKVAKKGKRTTILLTMSDLNKV